MAIGPFHDEPANGRHRRQAAASSDMSGGPDELSGDDQQEDGASESEYEYEHDQEHDCEYDYDHDHDDQDDQDDYRRGHRHHHKRRLVSFGRRRSVSLDGILSSSLVQELPETGERIIISRSWPQGAKTLRHHTTTTSPRSKTPTTTIRRPSTSMAGGGRKSHSWMSLAGPNHNGRTSKRQSVVGVAAMSAHGRIGEHQKRQLLVEYLKRTAGQTAPGEAAASDGPPAGARRRVSVVIGGGGGGGTSGEGAPRRTSRARRASVVKPLIVHYELAPYSGGPIALGSGERA